MSERALSVWMCTLMLGLIGGMLWPVYGAALVALAVGYFGP